MHDCNRSMIVHTYRLTTSTGFAFNYILLLVREAHLCSFSPISAGISLTRANDSMLDLYGNVNDLVVLVLGTQSVGVCVSAILMYAITTLNNGWVVRRWFCVWHKQTSRHTDTGTGKKKIALTYSTGGRESEYIALCLSVHRNHMWGKRNAHIRWVNCGVGRWWPATIVWIVPSDSIVSDVI